MFDPRILLLAPHPDDELAGCCGAIGRARSRGSSVSVAFLTTGIPARQRLWPWDRAGHPRQVERRRAEAQRVCGELGADIAHLSAIPARDLKNEISAVHGLVVKLCADRNPGVLWVPAYEGGHPDHDVANFIASTLRDDLPVWEFSEYNFYGRRVRSNEFFSRTGKEIDLELSGEEQRIKKMLLAMYASERGNLNYLGTEHEVFRPLAECDYSRPPHPGTLFYRRFAWAALHPRVNEVRPEEVSRAIAEFRARR